MPGGTGAGAPSKDDVIMIKSRWGWVALAMFAGVFAYAIFINA